MEKSFRGLIFVAAFAGLGVTMPSCPGQKEMQTQIDSLLTTNADLVKKVDNLTNQLNTLNTDMAKVKEILPQMTQVMQNQKTVTDQTEERLQELEAKVLKGKKKK